MHGLIHDCLKFMIQKKYGVDKWEEFLVFAETDESTNFTVLQVHSDDITYQMLGKAAEFVGLPLNALLEQFGEHFYLYTKEKGYGEMLNSIGRDLEQFLANLDFHHFFISSYIYGSLKAPSFRCERPDPDDPTTLHLQYISRRKHLYPVVMGMTRECAKGIFDVEINISVLGEAEEPNLVDGSVRYHTTLLVKQLITDKEEIMRKISVWNRNNRSNSAFSVMPDVQSDFEMSQQDFSRLHPFHIAFDKDLTITSLGRHIVKELKWVIVGQSMGEHIQIVHPQTLLNWESVRSFVHAQFVLRITNKATGNRQLQPDLNLKGQMFVMHQQQDMMLFVGSPNTKSLSGLRAAHLFLSDIPLYDVTRELTLLNQQRLVEVKISKELEVTTGLLKKVSKELVIEKQKLNSLLHELLPSEIGDALMQGREVQARQYELVSVLFADIVGFTVISANCHPMEIVNLLNKLFTHFDDVCSRPGIHKMETIGDAYMVAGGVPRPTDDHCKQITEAALEMRRFAITVVSPSDGKCINIRIGIHCGPVMAGVVGKKMPKYCLFGDTVNTASRMESHGVPGKVQISQAMKKELDTKDFAIELRGDLEVKGKGSMRTYFVDEKQRALVVTVASKISHKTTVTIVEEDELNENDDFKGKSIMYTTPKNTCGASIFQRAKHSCICAIL